MKSSRLVLLGFVIVALAVCVWWYARPAPELPLTEPAQDRAFPEAPTPRTASSPSEDRAASAAATPVIRAMASSAAPAIPPLAATLAETNRFERQHTLERLGFHDAGFNGFAAAMEALSAIERSTDRAAFLRGVFAKLAEGVPVDALRSIKQVPAGPDREAALRALVAQWETDLSPETWKNLEAQKAGVLSLAAGHVVKLLGDPALAVEAARELLTGSDQSALIRMAAVAMAESDPQRALRFADDLQGKERDELLHAVARAWGRSQGDAALAWALQQSDPAARAQLQAQVLTGWGSREPEKAAARLPQVTDLKTRHEVLQNIAASWAITDTKAALTWARSLPDPPARDQALAAIQSNAPVGIGVSLRATPDGFPLIDHLIPGSPASASAALKPGCQIAAISDGRGGFTELQGMDLGEVAKLIRGKPGTVAMLQVIPEGGNPNQRRTITVPRHQLMFKDDKAP